jgi:hypothetical protein
MEWDGESIAAISHALVEVGRLLLMVGLLDRHKLYQIADIELPLPGEAPWE